MKRERGRILTSFFHAWLSLVPYLGRTVLSSFLLRSCLCPLFGMEQEEKRRPQCVSTAPAVTAAFRTLSEQYWPAGSPNSAGGAG